MKYFFISLGLLYFSITNVHALKLYLVSNHDNAGDHNQVLGIEAAFEKLSSEKISFEDLNTKTITSTEIMNKIEKDLSHEKVIYIGAGEGGIQGVPNLPKNPNFITCLTSHMFLEQYKDKDLLAKIDFIALPTHVTADIKTELGPKLIETTGVAHNRHLDTTIYDKWKEELPPADVYFGVYLGGDAPTYSKKIKRFTEDDASRLADYIAAKVKRDNEIGIKTSVLVLNGPRTGKHTIEGKEILTVHREGKSDSITELFGKKLAAQGINFKIFDFQHNTAENKKWISPYNAVDLVMAAVKATEGEMLIPGESTSVISETIDVMPTGKVLVYHNAAMNDVHKAHLGSELAAGRVSTLEDYQNIKRPNTTIMEAIPSATEVIAKKLLGALNFS